MTDKQTDLPEILNDTQRQVLEAAVIRTLRYLRTLYGHDPSPDRALIVDPNGPLDKFSARTVEGKGTPSKLRNFSELLMTEHELCVECQNAYNELVQL